MRQVMSVHHNTVDSYLDAILVENVSKVSEEEAKKQVAQFAQQYNDVLTAQENQQAQSQSQAQEKSSTENTPQSVVENVLGQFLIPEVERQIAQHQGNLLALARRPRSLTLTHANLVETEERKFLASAHATLYETVAQTVDPALQEHAVIEQAAALERQIAQEEKEEDARRADVGLHALATKPVE